jgi:hypothetical protein
MYLSRSTPVLRFAHLRGVQDVGAITVNDDSGTITNTIASATSAPLIPNPFTPSFTLAAITTTTTATVRQTNPFVQVTGGSLKVPYHFHYSTDPRGNVYLPPPFHGDFPIGCATRLRNDSNWLMRQVCPEIFPPEQTS